MGCSRRAAIISVQRRKISGISLAMMLCHALGCEVRVAGRQRDVHELGPDRVVLLGDAHEAPDHAGDDRLGHVGDQVAAVAPLEAVEHAHGDLPDGVLVGGDPLGREARLEEHLQPVVLGRVHADEHRLHELEREPVGDRGDAAHLGGVGLPVPADGVDVVGPGDRPVAGLVGVLADARGPVDGAFVAQPGEQRVRRAVDPELPLGHQHLVEIAFESLLEVTTS